MKPGDIVQAFGDPLRCTNPLGAAKLIKKLSEGEKTEVWLVEYSDHPEYHYTAILKKDGDQGQVKGDSV